MTAVGADLGVSLAANDREDSAGDVDYSRPKSTCATHADELMDKRLQPLQLQQQQQQAPGKLISVCGSGTSKVPLTPSRHLSHKHVV